MCVRDRGGLRDVTSGDPAAPVFSQKTVWFF